MIAKVVVRTVNQYQPITTHYYGLIECESNITKCLQVEVAKHPQFDYGKLMTKWLTNSDIFSFYSLLMQRAYLGSQTQGNPTSEGVFTPKPTGNSKPNMTCI